METRSGGITDHFCKIVSSGNLLALKNVSLHELAVSNGHVFA